MPKANERKGAMLYAEVPHDVMEKLAERCEKSGWSKREEVIMALRAWFAKPVVKKPTKPE